MADPQTQQPQQDDFASWRTQQKVTTPSAPAPDLFAQHKAETKAAAAPPTKSAEPGFLDREIPLTGHWYNPTLSGLQSVGRGVRDAVVGTGQLLDPRAHGDMEQALVNSDPRARVALPVLRTVNSIVDTAKQVPQILPAIHDINASPDPLTHYGKAAQEMAGQGAGQAITALATEGAIKGVPKLPGIIADDLAKGYVAPSVIRGVSDNLAGGMKAAGKFVRNPLSSAVDAASYVGDKIGATNLLEKGKNFGLTPEELRVKDMDPQIKSLEAKAAELQKRINLAHDAGFVPTELVEEAREANRKLAGKSLERRLSTQAGREDAAQAAPTIAQPTAAKPAGLKPVAAATPEAPFMSQVEGMVGKADGKTMPPVTREATVPGRLAAAEGEKPFISQVEGMVNKASGTMPPVKNPELSIPNRPAEPALTDIPNRSYPTNPNLSAADARTRIQDLGEVANPTALEAPKGLPGVSVARDVAGEAHPVKIVYDEHGIPTAETDGRHRVIQAIERGDQRIEVTVDRGNGPVKTTYDPKKLAAEMGVTKESLANTDAQQAYRKGGLQPREPVKGNGSMVNKLGDEVERGLGGEPGIKQGVPMKDQFKPAGESDMIKPKETSSRAETQAFIDHGLTKAEGARFTKTLDQINNASLGDFAAKNGVDMGQSTVSRAKGGAGSMNRGAVVKDLLSRMTPEQIEAAVNKYVEGK